MRRSLSAMTGLNIAERSTEHQFSMHGEGLKDVPVKRSFRRGEPRKLLRKE
jgi:hypothetical protein